tara:strand:- start:12867 stop:15365 length:2499 start_codon:yes stop_codon:yes gene_type:complete
MTTFLWLLAWLGGFTTLAYHRVPLIMATAGVGVGLLITTIFSDLSWFGLIIFWSAFLGGATLVNHPDLKRRFITSPLFKTLSNALPNLSPTEKAALEAGTVGFEGELFKGKPNWNALFKIPKPCLTDEEQAFMNGPVNQLCEMTNDWDVTNVQKDLPEPVWQYIKDEGFWALIIPKKYGGKEFSLLAQSEILTTLYGHCAILATTVAVPNSLGPAELILHYGTEQQKNHYLPRLAKGQEIPCFALTGPDAGSDATAIPDTGIICKGIFEGKEITGIKLNWDKRYITLAPVATLLGLAFKLYDPEHLVSEEKDLGITCALIPTNLAGITIGNRHFPINLPFQNGPTQGRDVFIPLDYIIGGIDMAGQGWRMLVECLTVGRAISLPASGSGGAKIASMTTSAYSVIRRQFNTPLAKFEGVQEALARIGGFTYLCEAMRYLTVSMIDQGEKPSVPGAITKYHVTELGRKIITDTMDIHGGKGIMMGPNNYLANGYCGAPIGITVEGANILTRSLIIFGQGAMRCHPYVLKHIESIHQGNIEDFEENFGQHVSYTLSNMARSFFHAVTFSRFAASPEKNHVKRYYQRLSRASSAFALMSDLSMAIIGGKLKFKESTSARLGDLLSMLYMMSAVLKRYRDHGYPKEDFVLVQWTLDYCLATYWNTMDDVLHNFPNKYAAPVLKLLVMPFGHECKPPSDKLNKKLVKLMTTPSESRARLIGKVFMSGDADNAIRVVEEAFLLASKHQDLIKRVLDVGKNEDIVLHTFSDHIEHAAEMKILTDEEAMHLRELNILVQKSVAVDDFLPEEISATGIGQPNNMNDKSNVTSLNPGSKSVRN